jgi:integrase
LDNIPDNVPRVPKNQLSLEQLPDGRWRLFGYLLGEKIRQQSHDYEKLLNRKQELEKKITPSAVDNHQFRNTWLSEAQLRDAEAAVLRANGRKLLDCVIHAKRGDEVQRPIKREIALEEWLAYLRTRLRRFDITIKKNRDRVESFYEATPLPKMLHEFTAEDVEAWVFRHGTATYTQLTDASVLRTFYRHAVKMSWIAVSPVAIDFSDLAGRAKPAERPRILTPAQCTALLHAAEEYDHGRLVPYTVLATWCFARNAEVLRILPADIDWEAATPTVTIEPRKRRTVSYRRVPIPAGVFKRLVATREAGLWPDKTPVFWSRREWDQVRAKAGLVDLQPAAEVKKKTHRKVITSLWQENILRHTGISYRYQQTGDITPVCREAGNSSDTAFRHYLDLPREGAADLFYAV